ncbi:MAG: hypothetical protein U0519_04705 [Candidatus Gracilibacteria bacterium]
MRTKSNGPVQGKAYDVDDSRGNYICHEIVNLHGSQKRNDKILQQHAKYSNAKKLAQLMAHVSITTGENKKTAEKKIYKNGNRVGNNEGDQVMLIKPLGQKQQQQKIDHKGAPSGKKIPQKLYPRIMGLINKNSLKKGFHIIEHQHQ